VCVNCKDKVHRLM